ncbi:4-hydroxy-tetrahydrodipicolinate reductase [Pseudobacter ginsenosidimutans]|jgi:4-hydroxy-tetrahydrodipicolinate reductase|uniref:4-hydroxy-tetrahydrodipicolinate reductase n=1 Tax=Pseudobacter ginsenosidimutans TaxID=661488 RepID=A0A4Q7N2U8_9BACT|nr:4-hydroxy-tetrahydrodipicolinate reductase [Pseudobacter ginsenosidimutans]QEC43919.1 4-hydroxy-tetrahydrodipicolinate reductase [Pseudobacter ginsenosidimutans]RZS75349.1 dihydrodipicolinate reductase [Pseudobacter ginsenosidimutans]
MIRVFIAGATGWAGSALSKAVAASDKLQLVGALSRKHKGEDLAAVLGLSTGEIPVFDHIDTALAAIYFDVLVDYTSPEIGKKNIMAALGKGKNVVVGTSGLSNDDYAEIEQAANKNNASVLAVGNFSITVVLLQKFAEMAAKYISDFEIIDYAQEDKIDSPSGTARELAHRLSKVQKPTVHVPDEKLVGDKESRGASLDGVRVHSVRLPGFVIAVETIFGLKDEKLTIRHDAGASATPYVKGALLAIEKVGTFKGLRRGLDTVMDF